MVIPSSSKFFYKDQEAWAREAIRQSEESIALMAEIREHWRIDDWEIEELTRAIMFDESRFIESMRKEAECARAAQKKLESQRV